ncbi:MAG: hypothetical protein AAF556_11335 [Pseudomonadota bacterium]
MFKAPLLVAVMLLLGACSTNTQVGSASLQPAYSPRDLAYAGAGRDMEVRVFGNPFSPGVPDPVFGEAMAEAMRGQHFGPDINFTTKPDDSARPSYRIIMLFSQETPQTGFRICQRVAAGEVPMTTESSGSIPVKMAFCNGRKLLTEVLAHLGGGEGVTLETASELVATMTPILLPNRNPVSNDPLDSDYIPF